MSGASGSMRGGGGELKHHTAARNGAAEASLAGPAEPSRPVEIAGAIHDQGGRGYSAILSAGKGIKNFLCPSRAGTWTQLVNDSVTQLGSVMSGSVQIS